ncbi:hypothetical protein EYF80_044419 [Liparis tanakae]|uniref:Uncharacterized protein n=1 Tax=Liparis tanakae TaxID=230148 RepID=A0A4Z2FVW1_9TELE|nr:hypothetical protein EYF80_044419 [Liparis tanakae]
MESCSWSLAHGVLPTESFPSSCSRRVVPGYVSWCCQQVVIRPQTVFLCIQRIINILSAYLRRLVNLCCDFCSTFTALLLHLHSSSAPPSQLFCSTFTALLLRHLRTRLSVVMFEGLCFVFCFYGNT